MTVLLRHEHFLLFSTPGETLLELTADPQPSPLLVGRNALVKLVACNTLCRAHRSALKRAAGTQVPAAATARGHLGLLEQEGLTDGGGVP